MLIQSNSVITNSRGPAKSVLYNRDIVTSLFGPKIWQYFVRNKREFVITMIVITEFDCKSM